ncbi:tick transposon [Elysia marginata]|uniref:Tick transposon n=1 Tax=Elysia marginata TaxID=1093978 RepID=A0AAV4HTN3_9GAST|nr:tick transposon [Elysia marginata]
MAIQDNKLPEVCSSEDPSRGASLFVRNSIRATKLILNTNLVAVAARISCPKAVTVCSIYLLPGENISRNSFIDLEPKPYILLGDFNAHSPLWGDERLDQHGKMIEDFLISNDDILLTKSQLLFILLLVVRRL